MSPLAYLWVWSPVLTNHRQDNRKLTKNQRESHKGMCAMPSLCTKHVLSGHYLLALVLLSHSVILAVAVPFYVTSKCSG